MATFGTPLDLERAEAAISDFVAGKTKTYGLEHRLKTRDGQWMWIVTKGDIVSWTDDGRAARTIGTHTDISPQKIWSWRLSKAINGSEEHLKPQQWVWLL
ncbi:MULTISPECIES: PAS domain-containing protein [unclassified Marinobacter]|uniref:PAS domain-containing protein n=1 Tax=Marinobacter sp. LV10R510-11A TaxID=1415568 RepID=UPI000BB87E37